MGWPPFRCQIWLFLEGLAPYQVMDGILVLAWLIDLVSTVAGKAYLVMD